MDKLPTEWGSLLNPDILAQVDAEILVAAQEVHGEQQVDFLNEIADAYRVMSKNNQVRLTNPFERQAQSEWLDKNPISQIDKGENLNNAIISIEEEAARFTTQQQQQGPAEPLVEEEPILITESSASTEGTGTSTETEGESGTETEGESGTETEGESDTEGESKSAGKTKKITFKL